MHIIGRTFEVEPVSYEITIEINRGGFGTVYLAEPTPSSAVSLVVKVPSAHVLHNAEWQRRFQREARILANISHPNVVKTLGLLEYDDGAVVLVQEHIKDAVELCDWKYSSEEELVSVVLQVLYGLRCTHGASEDTRAIHRDLSPRNILVTPDGVAKIIDFGLAKEDPRTSTILTLDGRSFGTPGCMAPEQRSNTATVDHRADLYALGRSIASCIQRRHPEFVDVPLLDTPWREIVEKLTAFSQDDRFDSAEAAIRQILHDFQENQVLPASIEVHFEEFRRWKDVPDEWAVVARDWFLLSDTLNYADLLLAYRISQDVLDNPKFCINVIFAKLNSGAIATRFGGSLAIFEDCDPLGEMIRRWYPFLNQEERLRAFRRLCQVAVWYHRFFLMGMVRTIYCIEKDPALQVRLLEILEEEDPTKVIHGNGVIPRF